MKGVAVKNIAKHDVSALLGIAGSVWAQLAVGVHNLVPLAVGGGVIGLHQLTAFARSSGLAADVQADLNTIRAQVGDLAKANASTVDFVKQALKAGGGA